MAAPSEFSEWYFRRLIIGFWGKNVAVIRCVERSCFRFAIIVSFVFEVALNDVLLGLI